jgi:hypothetical protein
MLELTKMFCRNKCHKKTSLLLKKPLIKKINKTFGLFPNPILHISRPHRFQVNKKQIVGESSSKLGPILITYA